MPDTDGVTLLKEWASSGLLDMPVIMMSGHATIDTAVEATKIGAQSFLEKPITLQKLLKAVSNALVVPAARKPPPLASIAQLPEWVNKTVVQSGQPVAHTNSAATEGLLTQGESADQGLHSLQKFDLDKPLRNARDEFEKAYF